MTAKEEPTIGIKTTKDVVTLRGFVSSAAAAGAAAG